MDWVKFDYNNVMQHMLGERGYTVSDIDAYRERAESSFFTVQSLRGTGMLGWTELPYNQKDIAEDIVCTAEAIRGRFENFVILGIGGSALGPSALFQALKHTYHNQLSKEKRNAPRFYVLDNIDPEKIKAFLDVVDIKDTMFNAITKSGATSETMSQYLIFEDILKSYLGERYSEHIVATTDCEKGSLIKIAKDNGYKTFFVPAGVGGRFSVLSPVGLLPASVIGIDIKKLLEGAAEMDKLCANNDPYKNPALMAALIHVMAMDNGINISVSMPYAESLKLMADWYCQLWGESLGKATDKNNKLIYSGQTPVKSLGVTDQHSQIQLYTEGPFDKIVTFIETKEFREDILIPNGCEKHPDVNFLCGNMLSKLFMSEFHATKYALTKAQRHNCTIILSSVNENTIGQLISFYQLMTAYAGEMLNIDAYNQPGVEEGKNAAYALFGRKGYDDKRKELESQPKPDPSYIIG